MARETKYNYFKVIQEYWDNWGNWCDSDFYETDSSFCFNDKDTRARFKENLKLYHQNAGCPIRVINRRELKEKIV